MNISLMHEFAAIAMAGLAVILVFAYRRYLATNSERRMTSMLEAVGLDPALASSADTQTIMSAVRKRCRSCASEDVCERWLRGDVTGKNDFCPNSTVFEMLTKRGAAAS